LISTFSNAGQTRRAAFSSGEAARRASVFPRRRVRISVAAGGFCIGWREVARAFCPRSAAEAPRAALNPCEGRSGNESIPVLRLFLQLRHAGSLQQLRLRFLRALRPPSRSRVRSRLRLRTRLGRRQVLRMQEKQQLHGRHRRQRQSFGAFRDGVPLHGLRLPQ